MDKDSLLNLYKQMLLTRAFEDKSAEMYAAGKIDGFLHLYNGQEAIAAGVISALNPDDDLFTHYRDHGYALMRGIDPGTVMAELYGRAGGTAGGRGGSMHLHDVSRHYWGGYAVVGGHLPMAVGMAYASQYQKTGRISLCVMGDGSTNIGTFHAALNWAQVWKCPIVFLVENNQFAMGTPILSHSPSADIARKADGYGMAKEIVEDGADVMAVREAVCRAVDHARNGQGPYFLEVKTYRYRGHSQRDPDVQRSKAEVAEAKHNDPITRFAEVLVGGKKATQADFDRIEAEVNTVVEAAVEFAENSPEPSMDTLWKHIYADPVANMQIGGTLIRPAITANGTH